MPRGEISSTTWGSAICGISLRASRIPCEFLLVFDDGDFDEDDTFLITDWFKHVPNEVLGKNFGASASFFGHTPDPSERYIFPARVPGPLSSDKIAGATGALFLRSASITCLSNFKCASTSSGGVNAIHWSSDTSAK